MKCIILILHDRLKILLVFYAFTILQFAIIKHQNTFQCKHVVQLVSRHSRLKIPKFFEMSNVVRTMKLEYVELDGPPNVLF